MSVNNLGLLLKAQGDLAGAAPLYVPPVSRIYCDNKPAAEKSSFKKVMFSAARRRSTSTPMPRPPTAQQVLQESPQHQ